ncbi:hypothetical protein J2Y39_003527 [Pseudomonas sp. 2957]|jgi:hypothetical protein|nr:hypothetical protein ASG55_11200 [Pseudomonas sp. Leaf434]MDR6948909.1 hypothetical protein [Pseudomonas sp. 2957]
MQAHPEMMVSRRSIVEHPFGNLKQWLFGNARFLLRQLEGARAEMALAVNAYNLKRAINVLSVRQMMALMGLKRLFSSAVSTKANAPNKSGRLLEPPSVRFHTVCLGGFPFNQFNTQAQLVA